MVDCFRGRISSGREACSRTLMHHLHWCCLGVCNANGPIAPTIGRFLFYRPLPDGPILRWQKRSMVGAPPPPSITTFPLFLCLEIGCIGIPYHGLITTEEANHKKVH